MTATQSASCLDRPQALQSRSFSRPISRRMRLFNWLLGASGGGIQKRATDSEVIAAQRPIPRNVLTNMIFGSRADHVDVHDELLPSPHETVSLRIYSPAVSQPQHSPVLYMHGGGWVAGDVGLTDWWCSEFAARTRSVVASVGYRLAPGHRFPAPLEDCFAALCWLDSHRGVFAPEAAGISVMGDSAGANLAAALCLYVRERGGPRIIRQTLINPCLDLTMQSPSIKENASAPILTEGDLKAYIQHYLGSTGRASDSLASPLLASDLSNLPPALIQVAEHDPLRDDGWRYSARLADAGVPVRITEYAGATHGLANFPGLTRTARRVLEEACVVHGTPLASSCSTTPADIRAWHL